MSNRKTRSGLTRDRVILAPAVSAALLALCAGAPSALAQNAPAPSTAADQPTPPESAKPTKTTANDRAAGLAVPNANASEPKGDTVVKVDDKLVVDLHVNDEDLTNVLQMLSIQSQRNIVCSNNVNAKVKADLYGVTFYEALDAILHVNGYGYIDKGNFIYVYTLDELQQIEKASRVRVSKVIKLNYLNSIDAAEFVKPLLSEGGQIKTNGKTEDYAVGSVPVGKDNFAHDATLVIYDYQEHVGEIEKLVKELDTRPAQVLVEATILQSSLSEDNAFGVDFSLIADLDFSDFSGSGGPLKSVDNLIAGKGKSASGSDTTIPTDATGSPQARALQSTPGNTSGPGTLKLGLVANDVAAFVRMLDQVTDTTILSNPKILSLNRQASRVLVGRKVGYLSTTSTDTTSTQTVEFLDTGTQLYFRPFITNDGLIRMELKPQVSEAVIRDTKDATGAAVTIPDEITNEMVTNVMVRDGQTVVLGGLFRESTQATRRQVPFLGDIPLLGAAFRGHEDTTQRSEIIFLITPSIVNDAVLTAHGKDANDYVERARTGAREGLLPWSRDKMTSIKLVEAERLAAEGKTDQALWKIEQSLSLNPAQPDAIALRDRLSSSRRHLPNRSVLDHIIHQELRTTQRSDSGLVNPVEPATAGIDTDSDSAANFSGANTDSDSFSGGRTGSAPSETDAPGEYMPIEEYNSSPEVPPQDSTYPEAPVTPSDAASPSAQPVEPAPQPTNEPSTEPGTSPSTEPPAVEPISPQNTPGEPSTAPGTNPENDPSKTITVGAPVLVLPFGTLDARTVAWFHAMAWSAVRSTTVSLGTR